MGGEVHQGKTVIAAFDFDGTIIRKDSLPLFIWHAVKLFPLLRGTIQASPALVKYAAKLIPNDKAKEALFAAYFRGMSLELFDKLGAEFVPSIHAIVRPEALAKIKWHQQQGHEVVIISASPENWVKPWAAEIGIKTVLATQVEVVGGLITGKFASENCHGPEKVNRLMLHSPKREAYELYAYGDSSGDTELLKLADYMFYRKFN
jgi:phosphatidylglycerophosphatase C